MDEALTQRHRATDLNPQSSLLTLGMGDYFLYARQPQHAIEEAEKLLRRNPSFVGARVIRGRASMQLDRFDPAIADLAAAHEGSPESAYVSQLLVAALAGAGRRRDARSHVDAVVKRAREQYVSPFEIGLMYAALDDRREAFRWLEKACDIKDPRLAMIRASERADRLRSDPRFPTLLACTGLP
jgi:predicted Zn-dependent protease